MEQLQLEIGQASVEDRDFVLFANKQIDKVSDIEKSALAKNVDADVFDGKKCVCLVAKCGGRHAGMLLFSRVYWADRGQGIYVSQAFVCEPFRKQGVFKKMLQAAFDFYPDTQFVTLLVAKGNLGMQKCVKNLNFECEDMMSFVVNKTDFENE